MHYSNSLHDLWTSIAWLRRVRVLLLMSVICAAHQARGLPAYASSNMVGAHLSVSDSLRPDTLSRKVTLLPEQGALMTQLTHISQEAHRQHLTPVLDLGAWWCGPCHQLDSVLATPTLQPTMQQVYLIHLEYDLWHDALDSLHVVLPNIPRLAALDSTGRPVRDPWSPDLLHGWSSEVTESIRQYLATAQKLFH